MRQQSQLAKRLTDEIEANLKAALEEFLPKFKEQ